VAAVDTLAAFGTTVLTGVGADPAAIDRGRLLPTALSS
jgi:hypothetical protein